MPSGIKKPSTNRSRSCGAASRHCGDPEAGLLGNVLVFSNAEPAMFSALAAGFVFALMVLRGLAFASLLADYAIIAGASILFVALTALPYEIARRGKDRS